MSEERIKAKVLEDFGARITVFENGSVYVSTCGDVHILARRNLFDEYCDSLELRDEKGGDAKP